MPRLELEVYDSTPFGWAESVILMRIEPDAMYAYAPHPEHFPESGGPASAPPGR